MRTLKRQVKRALVPFMRKPGRTLPLSTWDLQQDDDGALVWDAVRLSDVAQRYPNPTHVVSLGRLQKNLDAARESGADIFYSYKTNPVPSVLKWLHDRDVGAEVISAFELWLAVRLGVSPHRIIYNGAGKSEDSLRQACALGVRAVFANSIEEVRLLGDIAAAQNKTLRVGIRVMPHAGWEGQFGVRPALAAEALRAMKTHPHLEPVGIHVHRGVPMMTHADARDHLTWVRDTALSLQQSCGLSFELVDVGGSLAPPSYAPLDRLQKRQNIALLRGIDAPDVAQRVTFRGFSQVLSQCMQGTSWTTVIEPGRALTADTQLLLMTVMNTKQGDGGFDFAVLNAGTNHADTARFAYHALFSVEAPLAKPTNVYRLVGPICTPGDVLYPAAHLPKLHAGSTLAMMDTGGYFIPLTTTFSYPRPGIVSVCDGDMVELRAPESFDDIVRLDHLEAL